MQADPTNVHAALDKFLPWLQLHGSAGPAGFASWRHVFEGPVVYLILAHLRIASIFHVPIYGFSREIAKAMTSAYAPATREAMVADSTKRWIEKGMNPDVAGAIVAAAEIVRSLDRPVVEADTRA